ncbi:MAG: polyprenol monophosphomannose synthase [bacterium]
MSPQVRGEHTTSGEKKILVIIPTYNERDNIEEVIRRVLAQSPHIDVLVVDDNSPDGTAEIVENMSREEPRIGLIRRRGKMGLGTAYLEGFRYGLQNGYHYLFEMDADLSHDPAEIPHFLKAIRDAHLVIGSRYLTGVNVVNWPLSRLLLSYLASVYVRLITGLPLKDATSGFKCYRREVLETINLNNITTSGYGFQVEMKWRTWMEGFKLKEIPIIFVDRTVGKSKMSRAIVREAIILVLKLGIKGFFKRFKLAKRDGWRPLN